MKELPPPPSVLSDPDAVELVRVWGAHGKQHFILSSEAWDDPATWGIALVDLAKLLAGAYQERGWSKDEALRRIRSTFDAEWSNPTDEPTGGVLK